MKIERGETEIRRIVRVWPFANAGITVSSNLSLADMKTWSAATVNWPAIGAVSPQEAAAFAEALAAAAREAEAMDARRET